MITSGVITRDNVTSDNLLYMLFGYIMIHLIFMYCWHTQLFYFLISNSLYSKLSYEYERVNAE